MQKRHTNLPIKQLSLIVLSIFAALVAVELILRLVAPIYPVGIQEAYEYDPELGYRLRPAIHLFKTTDFQQEVRVNHLGTANFQESFTGYESLVFALGDSYTHGTGLPADMAYPFQLDLLLNRDNEGIYRQRFGVVNLGLAGFGGEQALLALRRWASLLHPPAVILYLGCNNDFEDDLLFKGGYRRRYMVAGSPFWGRMVAPMRWLTNDLQLGLRMKLVLVQLKQRSIRESANHQREKEVRSHSVAELESPVLARLVTYANEYGSWLVVSWSDAGPSYDWLKSWATQNGIAFADWVPKVNSVRSVIPALPEDNQHSGGHHRAWVNRLIADEFARQIRAHTPQD